ncbi:hypothetical protein HYPSUDRAFT_35134 [Hypholoma sublateritium FD-334 SS-4]|uniref:Uncharacterized protein n=1 Tax=Hypholoma sublateritium (strain FD-334 SS-4) TaxID=945553 RepID=A0A0D2MTD3_HYPSF|nr:hypothetical protein HYPSUDRAFT_35134 [Hypholoma sublateritium FD-334 SS-4]
MQAPKKDKKEETEEEIAFKQKKKEEEAALKASGLIHTAMKSSESADELMPSMALLTDFCAGGPLVGGGIKK